MDPNTVNMSDLDPEAELICPYDANHNKIPAKSFPYHLMRCKKNWIGKTMLTCCFNARHIVSASEHKYHISICPDRVCIEPDLAREQRKQGLHDEGLYTKGCTELPSYNRIPSPTEDWDEEISAEPHTGYNNYNPSNYLGPPVSQNVTGWSGMAVKPLGSDIPAEKSDEIPPSSLFSSHVQAESTASVKVHLTSGPPSGRNGLAQPSSSTVGPPPGFAPNSQLRRPKQPAIAGSQQSVSVKP